MMNLPKMNGRYQNKGSVGHEIKSRNMSMSNKFWAMQMKGKSMWLRKFCDEARKERKGRTP